MLDNSGNDIQFPELQGSLPQKWMEDTRNFNLRTQVGFAELKETADDRANIGGTIIGALIVGEQLAQYI